MAIAREGSSLKGDEARKAEGLSAFPGNIFLRVILLSLLKSDIRKVNRFPF